MAKVFNLASDSTTDALRIEGKINIAAFGVFGGGSLAFELSFDDGATWFPATDAQDSAVSLTAARSLNLEIGKGAVRFVLSGATSPAVVVSVTGVDKVSKI
jgi:hypothetical protein